MSNPLRARLIRQNILEALKWAGDFPVLADALRSHVAALVKPSPTDEEWAEHIKWLLDQKAIAPVEAKFDSTLAQYTITEKGLAMLASL